MAFPEKFCLNLLWKFLREVVLMVMWASGEYKWFIFYWILLTDEDVVIRVVGEDDGLAEQSRGVVCGGGHGWRCVGEGDALDGGLLCGSCSMDRARFDILRGWSWNKEWKVCIYSVGGEAVLWNKCWPVLYLAAWTRSSAHWWLRRGSRSPRPARGRCSPYLEEHRIRIHGCILTTHPNNTTPCPQRRHTAVGRARNIETSNQP